jgi:hypothetical protein
LIKAVTRREIDLVAAWSVDRLGRSLQDLVGFLGEVHGSGVDLYLHRQGIDTSTPAGKALFQMMGVFAEFERAMIQQRVSAGLARARAAGKVLGRPTVGDEKEAAIRACLGQGFGLKVWFHRRRGVEERGHHSLTIKNTTGEPACECVGLHVFDEEDLDKAKSYFDRNNVTAQFVEVPYQGRTLRFFDVMGTPVELVAKMQTQPRSHVQVHAHHGARALRMDHFQVLVPDVMRAAKFYMDLGFRISDYLVVDGTDFRNVPDAVEIGRQASIASGR